ncbi:proteinase-activated receptor 3 [Pygocentrus nattereri]|uniref:G-protein coupled receptors family 1 profile domain-containing protein n=1 Tax=Pygocentrus nattereri TaxID=42514 RepID=A0AAR2KH99_PYGNA|nr:proteinase-activated receptor 3 [Pygocentrus nattereri]
MYRLLLVLLYVFMLSDSVQAKRKKTGNDTLHPKTFNARRSGNTTLPELDEISNHVRNYTAGILSTRIIPAAYFIAILIGIPSNCLVLACLINKIRTLSSAILYFSLAVSDLLLLVSLTLKVHYHLNGNNWMFGELACKLVTACFYGNIYCSIHAHMCISVLRYLAVVHPFLYRGLSKRSCTTWASLTMWVYFAAAMAPELLIHQSYNLNDVGITTCHDVLPYNEEPFNILIPYRLCLICLGYMFPFVVIAYAYGSIVHQLNRSCCDWAHYIKASTLVFVIFFLCFTPSNAIHLIHYARLYTSQQDDFYIYFSVAVCLCCFHSCLDPFLSYFITKTTNSQVEFISLTSFSPTTSTNA